MDRVELVPGLSDGDHNIVYFEVSTKNILKNIDTQRVPLYSRADWDEMRKDMQEFEANMQSYDDASAEDCLQDQDLATRGS